MTPRQFVQKYWPEAMKSQLDTGIPALTTMAQAALETGWGSVVVGNMMFGKKDSDGINGNEQLLTTTEYFDNPDKKFPVVLKVVKVGAKLWKYTVKDWFRKYDTPADSFRDHARLLISNQKYKEAMNHKNDPYRFALEISKYYATAPNYYDSLEKLMNMISKLTKELFPQELPH